MAAEQQPERVGVAGDVLASSSASAWPAAGRRGAGARAAPASCVCVAAPLRPCRGGVAVRDRAARLLDAAVPRTMIFKIWAMNCPLAAGGSLVNQITTYCPAGAR